MRFEPAHIIQHPEYGIGVIQKTDWQKTSVAFVAAADQVFSTRDLKKSAIIIDGPALFESHCPPDWDAPPEEKASWKRPIPQAQFHPQDSHRELLEPLVRCLFTLVLNSVGVFSKATHFAGRHTSILNPGSVETAQPSTPRQFAVAVEDESYTNILEADYPNKTHRKWKPKTGQKLSALVESAGVRDLIARSLLRPAAALTYADVAYSAIKNSSTVQDDCKTLVVDWAEILNKIAQAFESSEKYSREHTFQTQPLRKNGLPVGACARCGSELFFEKNGTPQCRDCGKYSATPRKGKLPFQNARTELAAILSADDDAENLNDRVEDFLSQPAGVATESGDLDPSVPGWGLQISLGDLIFSKKGWSEFSTNTQRPSSRRAILRATWLANRERLFHVLAQKYPLVQDLDGRLRTSAAGMTEYTKAQYRSQMRSAGREIACVYWFAFCGMTDAEIAKGLSEYRSGQETVTPEQVKNVRESFVGRGNTLYMPEPLAMVHKSKWASFHRVLMGCRPYQAQSLLSADRKTLVKQDDWFQPAVKYGEVQQSAAYALEQIRFGPCVCGRWKYLMPWNGEKRCAMCCLADLEAEAWSDYVSAKPAERMQEMVC